MVRAMDEEQERRSLPRQFSRSIRTSSDDAPPPAVSKKPSDIEMMKEKFAKLLLGEDMSGHGKGVSSALALSNAITNLAAFVFGQQRRLEPMSPEQRSKWRKEMDWFLSVTNHIVELVPVKRTINGNVAEVMDTVPRKDLQLNIPALRELDRMLIDCLDRFKDQTEFTYPKVRGLSGATKNFLVSQKDTASQVLKAALEVNSQVLQEMEVPQSYIDSLPKNGKARLGDTIYRSIAEEEFDVDMFMSSVDLSSEHKVVDLKNKIEASIMIWKRKMTAKDSKSSWVSMSTEKREQFEERAKLILNRIHESHPGIPQSELDMCKIQENKDVGRAILESYSRAIESLADKVVSKIDDVLRADEPETDTLADLVKRDCLLGGSYEYSDSPKREEVDHKLKSQDKPNVRRSYMDRLGGAMSPTSRH